MADNAELKNQLEECQKPSEDQVSASVSYIYNPFKLRCALDERESFKPVGDLSFVSASYLAMYK